MLIVGVDPGGQTTGLVLRDGDRLLWWALIHREDSPLTDYVIEVVEAVADAVIGADELAVEDLNDPNPHMGTVAVRGLLDTAQVIGALRYVFQPVMVPPSSHGTGPLAACPPELVGAREKRGTGKLRHCRAAWDIAGHAATLTKVGAV